MSRNKKDTKAQAEDKLKNEKFSCLFCQATGADPTRTTKQRLIHRKGCPMLEVSPEDDAVPEAADQKKSSEDEELEYF
jgi:hypothetical protein